MAASSSVAGRLEGSELSRPLENGKCILRFQRPVLVEEKNKPRSE